MASQAFKRAASQAVAQSAVQIGGYATPTATTTTVIGLSACNTSTGSISVDLYHQTSGGTKTYLAKSVPVPVGASIVLIGLEQKVVMLAGDMLFLTVSSTSGTADVFMSALELS